MPDEIMASARPRSSKQEAAAPEMVYASLMEPALFIFNRDLRLEDNSALAKAAAQGPVFACYFFEQSSERLCSPALQFLFESLTDLQQRIEALGGKLAFFTGRREERLEQILRSKKIRGVFLNKTCPELEPKARQRAEKSCKACGAELVEMDDATLYPFEALLKEDGRPYLMFTPLYRRAMLMDPPAPAKCPKSGFLPWQGDLTLDQAKRRLLKEHVTNEGLEGGRKQAQKKLAALRKFADYDRTRDYPAIAGTRLSAHLSFGTCSAREAHRALLKALGREHGLVRALYWREFFYYLAHYFPHVFKGAYRREFDAVKWSYDQADFARWCEGTTGFPLVDAGMRELNRTGFMHNRARLVVASFLTKDLLIDWRLGEEYFAKRLIDYDPAVNNGNWQWSAATGADAQPFFRVFNPWRQQQRFDPECAYIKKWVPELKTLPPKAIHALETNRAVSAYPAPMLDHGVQAAKAIRMFEEVKK